MKTTLSTILFILISISVYSFNLSDSLKAQAIFDEAHNLYKSREFKAAIRKFEKSSALFKMHEKYNYYLKSKLMIADGYWRLGLHEKSENISNQIIEECDALLNKPNEYKADAYRNLAQNKFSVNNFELALTYSTKGLNIIESIPSKVNSVYLDNCYNLRSVIYIYKSAFDSAFIFAKNTLHNT